MNPYFITIISFQKRNSVPLSMKRMKKTVMVQEVVERMRMVNSYHLRGIQTQSLVGVR